MIKTSKKILCIFFLIIISASISACSAASLPDALILQNKRYPQYANYLQGNDCITYNLQKGRYTTQTVYNILHLQVYSSDTSKISRRLNYNSTVTLHGNDKENTYIRLTDNFTLQPGSYTIYDGHVSDGQNIYVYVNGYDETGNAERVAELPDNGTFEVVANAYSYYRMYVFVAGKYDCDRTIFPMLCYSNTKISRYFSPIFSTSYFHPVQVEGGDFDQFIVFNITKKELSSIPYKDFQVFLNNLRYIYARKYVSCTIAFEDGTGIQFEECNPNKGIYGDLDGWYRAYDIIGIVTDNGSYLSLTNQDGDVLSTNQNNYGINGIGER